MRNVSLASRRAELRGNVPIYGGKNLKSLRTTSSLSASQIVDSKCQVASGGRGLEIKKDLDFDEWSILVAEFSRLHDCYQFMIGDLIAYGEMRYEPGRYMRAAEFTGRKYQTIHQWASTCRSIPSELRTFDLKFTHYYEVAFDIAPERQKELLHLAEQNRWSAQRLREEAKLRKNGYIDLIESRENSASPIFKALPPKRTKTKRKIEPGQQYGLPISLPGMPFGPTNELGVVALFSILAERLGFSIELIRVRFPDCLTKRRIKNRLEHCEIEFEFKSIDFLHHKHDPDGCDLIVCWEHNWDECPLPVIALREYLT